MRHWRRSLSRRCIPSRGWPSCGPIHRPPTCTSCAASGCRAAAVGLAGQYRLLALAPGHPAGQRALRDDLPMQVAGGDGGGTAAGGPAAGVQTLGVQTLGVVSFLAGSAASDTSVASVASNAAGDSATLLLLAQALYRDLPALRRSGDPAWRTWQPGRCSPLAGPR